MNPVKKFIVDELLERVNGSPYVLAFEYTGLTVTQFTTLRNRLAENGAECHVAKNTYMRKALSEAGLPDISADLKGQTAFVTGSGEVTAAAKTLKTFAKELKRESPAKIGVLDGEIIDAAKIDALADIPSRDVLLATLLSVINEPAASIARVIKAKYNPDSDSDDAPAEAEAEAVAAE